MPQTNLLFLYTDEQAFSTLSCYGNAQIEMPNLNRLAGQSTVFDEAYVTQPVCTPSRSSLLTGLWPHTSGCTENNVPLRPETPCLPEMLTPGRFATAHHGKWHLGDEIFAQHGFEEWVSIEDMYGRFYSPGRDQTRRSSYHRFLLQQGYSPDEQGFFPRSWAARLPEEHSKPAFLAREACRFLQDQRGRPFVLYVNFLEPHMPFFGPRDAQYDPHAIPLPESFHDELDDDQPARYRAMRQAYLREGQSGLPLKNEADWRRLIANYWGLCSLVDTHIGHILHTLEATGQAENTIVVFTSDHGDMMGAHRLVAKCVMFQEAIRVPLLIRLPGQNSPKRITGPVSQIDLVPTLLDLLGEPIPAHLQGKSLRPWLEAPGRVRHEEPVFLEWNGPNTGVRLEDQAEAFGGGEALEREIRSPVRTILTPDGWKYCRHDIGWEELYFLADDPHERRNLANQPAQRNRKAELSQRIDRWQETVGDR